MSGAKRRTPRELKAPGGSQSIRRAMDVVRFVAQGREDGRRLTEVAQALGLNITTAHRLLNTLVYCGLLTQRPETKIYRLGPELISLAAMAQSQFTLRDLFDTPMAAIAAETGDTVFLQVRSGDETVCLARKQGTYEIPALVLEVGSRLPLGAGSAGLAMLSYLRDAEREAILERCAAAYKSVGLRSETVRKAVRRSQLLGYGIQTGQMTRDVTGVSVLLLQNEAIAAAISVTALTRRLDGKRARETVNIIREACAAIPALTLYPATLPRRVGGKISAAAVA